MSIDNAFMELVQLHERTWGMEQYMGRPSLTQLLTSPIVIMWSSDAKRSVSVKTAVANAESVSLFTFSAHQNMDELNEVLLSMIVAKKQPHVSNRRIMKLYVKQRIVEIVGIRLMIGEE